MATSESEFHRFLNECQQRIEGVLDKALPAETTQPERLHGAMRYSALGKGKRIRPTLVYGTGFALEVPAETLDIPACAVELIHAYSLVHDDLPSMDDDDLRRGRPTCHRAYDEATAILAGDALQTQAFRVLSRNRGGALDAETRLRMIEALTIASGSRGMAGGQAMDLEAAGRELDLAQLENMHIHKTGALILASVRLGILAAGSVDSRRERGLEHYAKCIGLAFQVVDDILDVEGDTDTLGKTKGKDRANDKPTYPSLLGLEASRHMARRLCREAVDSLEVLDGGADPLRSLALHIVNRTS